MRANLCALERGHNETLHISSAQGYSVRQFYHAAARLLRSDILPVYISPSPAEPGAIILDNRRAGQVLQWRPEVDFLTGVSLAVERLYGRAIEVHTEPLAIRRPGQQTSQVVEQAEPEVSISEEAEQDLRSVALV